MINTLFIGYQYGYGNPEFGESLDVEIFVNSISKIEGVNASFFPIDDIVDVEINLKEHLENNKYDILLFNLISNELSENLLSFLFTNYKTVNWFGDDQWRFYDFSLKYAPYFKYIITTDKFKLNEYRTRGYENVILSQWAAISLISKLDKVDYLYDISFVGSYSLNREFVVEYLKSNGFKVFVFGNGWNKTVPVNEMNEIMMKSKINLNLSNSVPNSFEYLNYLIVIFKKSIISLMKLNFKASLKLFIKFLRGVKFLAYDKTDEQIKARNFEIPSNFGFQISKYALGIEDYYEVGKEIVVYNSLKELKVLCNYYLNNENERLAILNASYKKTFNHTYTERFKKILNDIN